MTYTGAASPLGNYLITGVSGTVAIRPAHVIVAVNETSKIYDGTAKNATITYRWIYNPAEYLSAGSQTILSGST